MLKTTLLLNLPVFDCAEHFTFDDVALKADVEDNVALKPDVQDNVALKATLRYGVM